MTMRSSSVRSTSPQLDALDDVVLATIENDAVEDAETFQSHPENAPVNEDRSVDLTFTMTKGPRRRVTRHRGSFC